MPENEKGHPIVIGCPLRKMHSAGIEPAASESESDVLSIKLQLHIFSYLFHKQPIYHSR